MMSENITVWCWVEVEALGAGRGAGCRFYCMNFAKERGTKIFTKLRVIQDIGLFLPTINVCVMVDETN